MERISFREKVVPLKTVDMLDGGLYAGTRMLSLERKCFNENVVRSANYNLIIRIVTVL